MATSNANVTKVEKTNQDDIWLKPKCYNNRRSATKFQSIYNNSKLVVNIKELTYNIIGIKTKHKYYIDEYGNIYSEFSKSYLKHQIGNNGYHRVEICRKKFLVHRLVAMAFIPNVDNKAEVNHKDTNVDNNCVNNLEWCTRKENNNYFITYNKRVKNIKRGENSNFSKLCKNDVLDILRKLKENYSIDDIANEYNVIPKTIRNIKNNKTWKHINRQID